MGKDLSTDSAQIIDTVREGYAFSGQALDLGALVTEGTAHSEVPARIPLSSAGVVDGPI